MRKHRITDADASALVTGRPHESRPELEDLAASLAEFRAASFETSVRPSAELASRLDLANATGISVLREAAQEAATIETTAAAGTARAPRRGLVVRVFTWFAGLGLAVKILLGTVVVAAAATGVGAAGALPPGLQDKFDEVVSTVVSNDDSTDETDETGTDDSTDESDGTTDDVAGYDPETGNFGSWVSDQAKDKPGTGREFGEMVSEEAKNKPHGGPNGNPGEDVGDDSGEDAGDTTDDAVSNDGSKSDGQHGVGGGPKKDSNK